MIFVCEKCLTEAGKQSTWVRAAKRSEQQKKRMWSGQCDVCGDVTVCAAVSGKMYSEVCRNRNPTENDPDAMCSHPGHPDHYGDW
jgi:hypothetical protein